MNSVHLDRLAIFAQHGQPKDYGGSEMMRADLTALVSARAASGAPQEAPGDAPSDKLDAQRWRYMRATGYDIDSYGWSWALTVRLGSVRDKKLAGHRDRMNALDAFVDAAMKGPQ